MRTTWDRRLWLGYVAMAAAAGSVVSQSGSAQTLLPREDLDDLYTAAVDTAIRRGIAAIEQSLIDAHFLQRRGPGRNPGIVGLVTLALLSNGGQPQRPPLGPILDVTLDYLLTSAGENGFIHDPASLNYGPMYEHGFATLALAEVYGTGNGDRVRAVLEQAVQLIVQTQNPQGGWRYSPAPKDADLSVTVCQMMALRAARNAGLFVPAETIQRGIDYVRRSQNPDGGFMYQLNGGRSRWPLTAAAIVAMQNAGIYQGDALDQAYAYLRANQREVAVPGQANYFFYAHYYAIQAFWQRGPQAFRDWYADLRDVLLRIQSADGTWPDYVGRLYGTAMACLILSVPRSTLPIFQR